MMYVSAALTPTPRIRIDAHSSPERDVNTSYNLVHINR